MPTFGKKAIDKYQATKAKPEKASTAKLGVHQRRIVHTRFTPAASKRPRQILRHTSYPSLDDFNAMRSALGEIIKRGDVQAHLTQRQLNPELTSC